LSTRSRALTWDPTTAIEALAAADAALWIWTPAEDQIRFTGATRPLGLGPLAPQCSGAAFTALALVTGSLWGQPMWGTWWVWDARLTSVLVLFLFYLGYMALRASIDDEVKAARAAAVLGLVGLINLPIVKFSVDWWNTLHQPASLLRSGGTSVDPVFLPALLTMMAAYAVLFGAIWLTSIRTEVRRRRVLTLRARAALEA
jgi:heme exporter protein C